jgi:mono/diheme cytochrome c family protein
MTSLRQSLALVASCVAVVAACDESEVLHEPDPGFERMLVQRRGSPYAASSVFQDGRLMRAPPPGTVARERSVHSRTLDGAADEASGAGAIPLPVTRALLERGHAAFERICATCHGVLGDGNSVVAEKMVLRKPPSLHEARIASLPPGRVFEVVSDGYGLMPGFAAVLDADERWAVVVYLDALRLSQSVSVNSLPPALRLELAKVAP